jgi:hypothetical protein
MLRCMVEIDATVDVPHTVVVMWLKSGAILGSNIRRTISNVTQLSPYMYETSLSLDPLSRTSDGGTYTCQAAVNPDSSLLSVRAASHSNMEIIIVQGSKLYIEKLLYVIKVCTPIHCWTIMSGPSARGHSNLLAPITL